MGCLLVIAALAFLGMFLGLANGIVTLLTPYLGETVADGVAIVFVLSSIIGMMVFNRRFEAARGIKREGLGLETETGCLTAILGFLFGYGISRRNRRR